MPSKSSPPPATRTRSDLAENVRRLRKGMNLNQEELAELADFHRTYVSQVECCNANITIGSLDRLAEVLGVTAVDLLLPPGEEASKDADAESRESES